MMVDLRGRFKAICARLGLQVSSAACSTAIKGSGVALIRHAVELQGARGMKLLFIAIHKGKMQHL